MFGNYDPGVCVCVCERERERESKLMPAMNIIKASLEQLEPNIGQLATH